MAQGLKFSESTIGGVKYLYHGLTSAPPLPSHRDIIRKNSDKLHIVPYTHQSPDGSEMACFELGGVHQGLVSLVHVFHPKRPIKMEELILLMHGIVSTIISGVKLGLSENSFVLEPRYIYMKRNSTQAQLVYLPMQVDTPLKEGFGGLVEYLSNAYDGSNPLTKDILTALKHIAAGDFNYRDVATVVVQAANNQMVDKRFLVEVKQEAPPAPTPQDEKNIGFFRRLINTVSGGKDGSPAYEDPFADFDERTMIDKTNTGAIGLNVAVLYEMDGDARVYEIPITKDAFVLGRKRDEVDHCFDGDGDKGISRVHASVIFDGNGYYLTDKGSSGGTFLNGKRLAPGQPVGIKHADKIQLYEKKLLFECSGHVEGK